MTQGIQIFRRLEESEASLEHFSYDRAFARNVGLLTEDEQRRLRSHRVALPGGGVASLHAEVLARLGIGGFVLADAHTYQLEHFNRQFGARCSTVGHPKADVIRRSVLDINPHANVTCLPGDLDGDNVEEFLAGVDLVVDSLGYSALDVRHRLIPAAVAQGIPVVLSVPVGFSCAMVIFTADSMAYEEYFAFRDSDSDVDRAIKFAVGVAPAGLHHRYMSSRDGMRLRGSASALAVSLCASLAAAEAVKLLLGNAPVRVAPHYRQWDLLTGRHVRGRLRWGNRHPLQRLRILARRKRRTTLLAEREAAWPSETPPRG